MDPTDGDLTKDTIPSLTSHVSALVKSDVDCDSKLWNNPDVNSAQ